MELTIMLAVTTGLLLIIFVRIYIVAKKALKVMEIFGDENDNTTATRIARGQLKHDESLLYCSRRKPGSFNAGIALLILSVSLFALPLILLVSVGIRPGTGDFEAMLFLSFLIDGIGMAIAITACYYMFEVGSIFYFVTNRRLCIRKIDSTGKMAEERDIPAETIESVSIDYHTSGSVRGENLGEGAFKKFYLKVRTDNGKIIKLFPNGNEKNILNLESMARIITPKNL